jgi:hypothetical protein
MAVQVLKAACVPFEPDTKGGLVKILRQSLAFLSVVLLVVPAWGASDIIGYAASSRSASVHEMTLAPGSTIFSGDAVSVATKGIASISLPGGGQVDVFGNSVARLARNQTGVDVFVERGSASFRSKPGSLVEARLADATIRSAGGPAVAIVNLNTPDSATVVASKGTLQIATAHDSGTLLVPEGAAARVTMVPAQNTQGGAQPAGRTKSSKKKIAVIALILGGSVATGAAIAATREPAQTDQTKQGEISPFRLN